MLFDGTMYWMSMIRALAVSPMRHPRDLLLGHEGDKLPGNSAELSATACYSRINPLVRFHCPLASMAMMTLCIILKMPRLNGFRGNRRRHLKPGSPQALLPSNMKISKVPLKIMTLYPCVRILIISLHSAFQNGGVNWNGWFENCANISQQRQRSTTSKYEFRLTDNS